MSLPPITLLGYRVYAPAEVEVLMRDYAAAVREAALEEAAKVCEAGQPVGIGCRIEPMDARECAAAIRSLKESK